MEIKDIKGETLNVGDTIAYTDYNDSTIRIGELVAIGNNIYCEHSMAPWSKDRVRKTRMNIGYSKSRILKLK